MGSLSSEDIEVLNYLVDLMEFVHVVMLGEFGQFLGRIFQVNFWGEFFELPRGPC